MGLVKTGDTRRGNDLGNGLGHDGDRRSGRGGSGGGGSSWRCRAGRVLVGLVLVLDSKSRFDTGLPVPLSIVDEPVRKLFELNPGVLHDLSFFLFGGIGMMDVFLAHHPGFEVLHRFGGQARGLLLRLGPR